MRFKHQLEISISMRSFFNLIAVAIIVLTVYQLGEVITEVLLTLFVAFLFDPLLTYLNEKFRVPRIVTILFLALIVIILAIVFALVLIPIVVEQLTSLISYIPTIVNNIADFLRNSTFIQTLKSQNGGQAMAQSILGSLDLSQVGDLSKSVLEHIRSIFSEINSSILSISHFFIHAMIVIFLTFYFLLDFNAIKHSLIQAIRNRYKFDILPYYNELSLKTSSYFKAQLIVALLLGVMYSIALLLGQVSYWYGLGMFFGLLGIVPYLGTATTLIVGTLLAFMEHHDWMHPLLVVVGLVISHAIESSIITPKVMSNAVDIHPALVIIALSVGGVLLGFMGLIIAISVIAFIYGLLQIYFELNTGVDVKGNQKKLGINVGSVGAKNNDKL